MKIRSYFTLLACFIVLIPALLLGLGITLWSLSRSTDPIPTYRDLPSGAEVLTDQATWDKIRELLAYRPHGSRTFVFDPQFRLIFASHPILPSRTGQALTLQESIRFLQGGDLRQDIMLFQPGGTRVWIVLVQDHKSGAAPEAVVPALWNIGVSLAVILLISIGISLFMGRALATSIVKLERVAQKVAQGDLAFSVDLKGAQEVRSLGRALETMRKALLEEDARQSRFVMGVSHDLKSPLALIKGYVELLQDGPAATPEARARHFDLILDKVDLLDGMIDHLIDYSRSNTGDWQQTWRPLKLAAFLRAFGQEVDPDARLLGRSFVTEVDLPEDFEVACDARSIRRSLENLIHNALRYTEAGGTVGLRAQVVGAGVEITVWDDGPGLDPVDLPHLFDPFYRGTHSRREPGMGLGLSIVKTILASHGWTIRAESDRGARFIIGLSSVG